MTLTRAQQIERFGMTTADAHALRDRVAAQLSVKDTAAARAAWQALAYELRGNKGGPMLIDRHPEAVRFTLLRGLRDGLSIEAATDAARQYARS